MNDQNDLFNEYFWRISSAFYSHELFYSILFYYRKRIHKGVQNVFKELKAYLGRFIIFYVFIRYLAIIYFEHFFSLCLLPKWS